jgi:hypothetical protein
MTHPTTGTSNGGTTGPGRLGPFGRLALRVWIVVDLIGRVLWGAR